MGKNWKIFPDAISGFINMSDCDDTINGICLTNKTFKECMDISENSGYYLTLDNGNTICVPLSSPPYLNPVYKIQSKDDFKELKNVKVDFFINTDIYKFPPDLANVVFYRDIFSVITEKNKGDKDIQFIHSIDTAGEASKFIPVKYGDILLLSIYGTSLFASIDKNNNLIWDATNNTTFKIIGKKTGEFLTYSDTFSLETQNVNKYTIENITLESKMVGYYCENNKCKSINIKDMEKRGNGGRYKGLIISRHEKCWLTCNKSSKIKTFTVLIILSIIIIILYYSLTSV